MGVLRPNFLIIAAGRRSTSSFTACDKSSLKSFNIIHKENFSDGLVINLLRKNSNFKVVKNNIENVRDDKVIIKVPRNVMPKEICDLLKEYEAIQYIKHNETYDSEAIYELNMIEQEIVEYIKDYIDKTYSNDNTDGYFYNGEYNKDVININSYVSNVCEDIYSQTVIINNEMINKDVVSAPIAKARNIVIDCILNRNKELIKSETSAEATIYKAIVNKIDTESIVNILKIMKNYFKKADKNKKDFESIYQILYERPYGVRRGVIPILTAIALDDFSEYVVLYFQNKEIDLSAENLSKIIDNPDKYFIRLQEGTKEKIEFVNELMKIFALKDTKSNRVNVQVLVKEMRRWILGLPRVIKELTEDNDILENKKAVLLKNELLKSDINNNEFLF